jgi:hypothetical protein
VPAFAQELPKVVWLADAARQSTPDADDGDGLGARRLERPVGLLGPGTRFQRRSTDRTRERGDGGMIE